MTQDSQHSVPGSGKTSLIHSIVGKLGLDVYVGSLAKRGLDDSSLDKLICALPLHHIVLMEDIDAAFHHAAIMRDGISGPSSPDLASPGSAYADTSPYVFRNNLAMPSFRIIGVWDKSVCEVIKLSR